MSRLVDADKVQMKLFEECQNIRHFDKDREKKQIFADGIDFAWVMLDNAPTVKAIPIEFIERKLAEHWYVDYDIRELLDDWEEENEKSGYRD